MNQLEESKKRVRQSIKALPDQINQAIKEAKDLEIPSFFQRADSVVISAMGGSRFPGVVVKALFKKGLKKPVYINDEYILPGWVGKNTAFIFSSYSGTTEEILFNLKSAAERTDILTGITTGGKLAEELKQRGKPVYVFNPVYNPSGQPRIAVGYAVGGIMALLRKLAVIDFSDEELEKALEFIRLKAKEFDAEGSLPHQIAEQVYKKIPFYIVSEFLRGFGNAILNQTNETAKLISAFHLIPELNHHLMEGLKNPGLFRELAVFIFFNSSLYSARIQKRFKITKEVVEKNQIETIWIELEGKSNIEQLFYALLFSSFYTFYLSELYKEDPSVIPFVDYFKKRLSEDD